MARITITIEDITDGVEMKVHPAGVKGLAQKIIDGYEASAAEVYTLKLMRLFRDIVKLEQHNAQAKSPIILPTKKLL